MTSDTRHYGSLSPARKRLIDVLRELQFGRIANLPIAGGEPQWTPAPTIVKTIKLPVEAGAVELLEGDCELKKPLVDLFRCFDRQQDAMISRLECRFGLPCLVEITARDAAHAEHNTDRSLT
jgi:hypothetical protein